MMQPISKSIPALRSNAVNIFIRTAVINNTQVNVGDETRHLKPWTEIPGPSSLPIIGQLHHFLPMFGGALSDISTFQTRLCELYGPIVRLDNIIGGPGPIIFLYDPDAIEQVLRGENTMPKRPGFISLTHYRKEYKKTKEQSLKPTGLITDHGENWKKFRSTVNPVLLQPKTIKLYSNVLDEVAQDMITRMRSIRDENGMLKGKFDMEMNLWALESIGVVALGGRLNCFDSNLAADSPESKLIQCVHDTFITAQELDFKPGLWRYYATKKYKAAMKIYEEQENLTRYFVTKAMNELEAQKVKKSDDEKGVLEKLLQIDKDTAVIMASDMLFGGVDTTSITMIALIYLLAMNPDKQKKLREELKNSDDPKRYLRACIKEALRMYPVFTGNLRQVNKEHAVLGYKIPKDMHVIFNHQYLSSIASQYPKPREFIPERWYEKDNPGYYGNAHPFSYSPFGYGVRMCIGRRIAELEIETFLAKLVQNFEIGWQGPPKPLQITIEGLNYIKGPYNFIFKDFQQ